MTGLEYTIKAYKALKQIENEKKRPDPQLNILACQVYNIIEAIVWTYNQCEGNASLPLDDAEKKDIEDILDEHWSQLFPSPSIKKKDINQIIGTHL